MLALLRAISLCLLLNLVGVKIGNAADDAVTFTINVDIANVRNGPSRNYRVVSTASEGQVFYASARNVSADWVQVSSTRNTSADLWIFAALGDLSIAIDRLPVVAAPAATTPTPMVTYSSAPRAPTHAPVIASYTPSVANAPAGMPSITPRARQLYAQALARGRNASMFMIAGDSNSEYLQYFNRVSLGWHGVSAYPQLPAILARWDAGARRQDANTSVSVRGGLSAAEMVSPFSHPSCASGESRFSCELRLSNASVVFIQLGTGDKFAWREFDANMRSMINHAIAYSVVPILVTKADSIEEYQGGAPSGYINASIRKLAAEYQVPLLDFYTATRSLPTIPNPDLPHRPFTQNGLLDEWGYYFHLSDQAKSLRIVMTLLTLDAITR
ncbi:MAG: hypothetical protein KIH69_000475 [Anaerolineae bacterium]|nr:hypothetical protein [Anaerolineae bacterium]